MLMWSKRQVLLCFFGQQAAACDGQMRVHGRAFGGHVGGIWGHLGSFGQSGLLFGEDLGSARADRWPPEVSGVHVLKTTSFIMFFVYE